MTALAGHICRRSSEAYLTSLSQDLGRPVAPKRVLEKGFHFDEASLYFFGKSFLEGEKSFFEAFSMSNTTKEGMQQNIVL